MLTAMLDQSVAIQAKMKPIQIRPYEIRVTDEDCFSVLSISSEHTLGDWLALGIKCLYMECITPELFKDFPFIEIDEKFNKLDTTHTNLKASPLSYMEKEVGTIYQHMLGESTNPLAGNLFIASILGTIQNPANTKKIASVLQFKEFDTVSAQKAVLQLLKNIYIYNELAISNSFVYKDYD